MAKLYWKDSWEYTRIQEVLKTYWLEEPDEACVIVHLDFLHKDGQTQGKDYCWINPDLKEEEYQRVKAFQDKHF